MCTIHLEETHSAVNVLLKGAGHHSHGPAALDGVGWGVWGGVARGGVGCVV
jgi:hypothetical protein